MSEFYVYFRDTTNTDPHASTYVERVVVEATDVHDAVDVFHTEHNPEGCCVVRSVDPV